jgi:endonuclease YncB( thermonuclease family)
MTAMDRRAELEGWIAKTRRLQRRLAMVYIALAATAIALFAWSRPVGGFALFGVALVAICSFWVTAAHNAAHRQKLAELERVADNDGKPLETGHRRWAPRER